MKQEFEYFPLSCSKSITKLVLKLALVLSILVASSVDHSTSAFSPNVILFGSIRRETAHGFPTNIRKAKLPLSDLLRNSASSVNDINGANGINGGQISSGVNGESLPSLPPTARVSMVGAGPGDPDLLTLMAARIIGDPEALIISDRLVSKEILNLVKGELRIARKLPGCADKAQEEIYDWVLEGLQEGRHVVRLKIGDPFVFGRGAEEVLKFREFGVEPVVIPVSIIQLLSVTVLDMVEYHLRNHEACLPLNKELIRSL
mmetsp:Transcript_34255/g.79125  ORF Transcript_34255/g.79125 Transcript_34255/m.79125 type:complete len:260 (-) Transcript_34255:607-1386(-)